MQLSIDKVPVIIHDYELQRTTSVQGKVKDFTSGELGLLDAGSWFDPRFSGTGIPTLEQIFNRYKSENILFNIELKTGTSQNQELEAAVLNTIDRFNLGEQVIISSFDHDSLVNCRRLNPAIRTGMIYILDLAEPWRLALSLGCYSVHPLFSYLESAETLQAFQKHNLALFPWTVNDPAAMDYLITSGVTGIITDYPRELRKIISG